MAYKESNPAVSQIVLFIVLVSLLILLNVIFVTFSFNLFFTLMESSGVEEMGLMAAVCSLYYIAPLTYLFMFVAFGVAMYKRGVYGPAHEKATLAALLISVLGPLIPVAVFIVSFTFEEWYYISPLLLHIVLASPYVALFLYVKDLGGKVQSATGLTVYMVGSLMLIAIETYAVVSNENMSEGTAQILSALSIPRTIVLLVATIFFMIAFVKALAWAKAHKPKIDEEQAQQLSMQKEQITMQIKQLEMQKQQLEMQEKTLSLLSDIRSDQMIGSGGEMIPERADAAREAQSPPEGTKSGDGV